MTTGCRCVQTLAREGERVVWIEAFYFETLFVLSKCEISFCIPLWGFGGSRRMNDLHSGSLDTNFGDYRSGRGKPEGKDSMSRLDGAFILFYFISFFLSFLFEIT